MQPRTSQLIFPSNLIYIRHANEQGLETEGIYGTVLAVCEELLLEFWMQYITILPASTHSLFPMINFPKWGSDIGMSHNSGHQKVWSELANTFVVLKLQGWW